MKLREYWQKKTLKQRIYLCIGLGLILTFLFFVIKGNFFDNRIPDNPQISQSESSDREQENSESESNDSNPQFHINWLDIGILAALFTAYGIHKHREKKKERR